MSGEYPDFCHRLVMPDYGMPLIATVLSEAGYDVKTCMEHVQAPEWSRIAESDLVCFSTLSAGADKTRGLAERIRAQLGVPIVILPGGVDSPVRAFSAVGGAPPFIRRGRGARIEDEDGGSYVDFVMSWGPLIHGHAPAGLTRVPAAAAKQGTSFGARTAAEVELGTTVRRLMPSLERVRFVNSGTEAAMSALRLARAATGRDRVVKFAGCYHGHGDAFRWWRILDHRRNEWRPHRRHRCRTDFRPAAWCRPPRPTRQRPSLNLRRRWSVRSARSRD